MVWWHDINEHCEINYVGTYKLFQLGYVAKKLVAFFWRNYASVLVQYSTCRKRALDDIRETPRHIFIYVILLFWGGCSLTLVVIVLEISMTPISDARKSVTNTRKAACMNAHFLEAFSDFMIKLERERHLIGFFFGLFC